MKTVTTETTVQFTAKQLGVDPAVVYFWIKEFNIAVRREGVRRIIVPAASYTTLTQISGFRKQGKSIADVKKLLNIGQTVLTAETPTNVREVRPLPTKGVTNVTEPTTEPYGKLTLTIKPGVYFEIPVNQELSKKILQAVVE